MIPDHAYGSALDKQPVLLQPIYGQTDQDWMKPGSRADREEMVRILVQDLKANVKVLDMHDYRCDMHDNR